MDIIKSKVETALALGMDVDKIVQLLSEDESIKQAGLSDLITHENIQNIILKILEEQKAKYSDVRKNVFLELMKFDYLYQQLIQMGKFDLAAQIHTQKVQLLRQVNLLPGND